MVPGRKAMSHTNIRRCGACVQCATFGCLALSPHATYVRPTLCLCAAFGRYTLPYVSPLAAPPSVCSVLMAQHEWLRGSKAWLGLRHSRAAEEHTERRGRDGKNKGSRAKTSFQHFSLSYSTRKHYLTDVVSSNIFIPNRPVANLKFVRCPLAIRYHFLVS